MDAATRMFGVDLFGDPVLQRAAEFVHGDRVVLSRRWGAGPIGLAIGCNPSDADGAKDDPTSWWLTKWFHHAGFGGYDLANLYPFCTSSPVECRRRADWAATNDWHARDQLLFVNLPRVIALAKAAHQVFVCWGNIAWDSDWIDHVVEEMQTGVAPWPNLWCWGLTGTGAPKHPMSRGKHRIAIDQQPILWRAA
ncbi:DUF1643 domain-containing protein [Sphingomonas hengshuiensis]|uniref:DUF1643 domain-containing protein n=1 Tax=Sphingomonas hengshuiensis TaxID=1609977 RepID=A0A7U4JAH9_9SPHN|nr:DUF1643 domain-containing protein [Sphingomonas hengshuiensis]AJP73162.1 hypothetical protein TS85_17230 [Sphingomonas hengshuiensis]